MAPQQQSVVLNASLAQLLAGRPRSSAVAVLTTTSNVTETDLHGFVFLDSLMDASLLVKPELNVSISADLTTATVSSNAFAPWTWLVTPTGGYFSDNGLFLLPNQPRTVDFVPYEAGARLANVTATSLFDHLPAPHAPARSEA